MNKKFLLISMLFFIGIAASAQKRTNPLYERGYASSLQLGYAFDESDDGWTAETSHGYAFGNGLYAGGGIGLHWMPDEGRNFKDVWMGAAFADVRYSFINRLVSPFVGARIGAFYDMREKNPGTMLRPYVGVDVWRFSLSAAMDQHLMRDNPGHYCLWHIQIAYNF